MASREVVFACASVLALVASVVRRRTAPPRPMGVALGDKAGTTAMLASTSSGADGGSGDSTLAADALAAVRFAPGGSAGAASSGAGSVAAEADLESPEHRRTSLLTISEEVSVYELQNLRDWPFLSGRLNFKRNAVDRHTNSPLCGRPGNHPCQFVGENECIVSPAVINPHPASHVPRRMQFRAAGPQETVVWDPDEVVAAIVTCGGLCPGLNTVIRELVMCLTYTYGVKTVYGVPNGYRGCYMSDFVRLVPKEVSAIHLRGGTILGSSRGKFNLDSILEGVARYGVNHLYVIGGDGTHRGALSLAKGAIARKLKMAVVAIPKTIDNDIPVIDKSFGFDTAVEQAVHPINCVHTEALAAHNGIGIVKLMGRHAGFIAVQASLASRDVNVCLIPEARFSCRLLCEFLEKRLASSGHAVIVIAEGAQISNSDLEACGAAVEEGDTPKVDESGNPVLQDVGAFLRNYLKWHFKERAIDVNIKYIDPTYMIRSVAANASDTLLCADLAFAAVHGAFAGYTGFTVGTVAGQLVWIPIAAVAQAPPRRVDVESRMFARLLGNTGQPSLQERGEAVDTAESDTWSWAAGT